MQGVGVVGEVAGPRLCRLVSWGNILIHKIKTYCKFSTSK